MDRNFIFFIEGICLLACSPELQKKALPDFVDVADELALMFDDLYALSPQLYRAKLLPKEVLNYLDELDELFDKMSAESSFWNFDSMRHDKEWTKTRLFAKQILACLEIEWNPNIVPVITSTQWIK
ncbi:hypothetical protein [Bacteroides sp.]|uniref:hypothetical protein n=1 Tax=Bacteroides sp. TaxID=29523 RepID=UPI004026CC3C